jgi:hypothetical protein
MIAGFLLLGSLISSSGLSSAKIGYSINVKVNNSSWGYSESTEILSFKADSKVDGNGRCSKYVSINGFASNDLKENTYADKGSISAENSLSVKSLMNYVHITEHVDNDSNRYNVEINESMPTVIISKDDFFYKGKGMYNRNKYVSGDNIINTDYYGGRLLKTVSYVGTHANSLIHADVTPSGALSTILRNETMALGLHSTSDKYSALSYQSGQTLWKESYSGLFTINANLIRREAFNFQQDEDQLGCCYDSTYAP